MDLGLAGKTVIVTGGGSNIGRGISLAFAREGGNVVIAELDRVQGKKVVAEIDAVGGKAAVIACDYPDVPPRRWLEEFTSGDYEPEVIEKVLYKNAIRILNLNLG